MRALRATGVEDLVDMQVSSFKSLAKLIAEYDLWDEMEAHLKARGCTEFLISGEFLRGLSSKLKREIRAGAIPDDFPAIFECDCIGNLFGTGKARPTAPEPGGGVLPPGGTTKPVGGTDGGTGTDGGDAG